MVNFPQLKVLHLPTAVGGNAWGLAQGEKTLGLQSEVLVSSNGAFQYPCDHCLNLESRSFKLGHLIKTFFEIRNKYDIFHFNYGSSLIHIPGKYLFNFDLPFYPKEARLFVTYNGCDARQKYPTMKRCAIAACHEKDCYGGMCNSGKLDENRRKAIKKMSKYVQHIWALNPDLLNFLPLEKSSFLPYTICNYDSIVPQMPKFEKKKLRIVHAPTNQAAKGSRYILDALKKLQAKYPNELEIDLIQNLPHVQALEKYKNADLVIDQVLIGWYGAFAVETMLMGKPVIARINFDDLKFIPPKMAQDLKTSIIHADPFSIESVLEQCILDRKFLQLRGEACLEYAKRWHNPKYIAGITKAHYEGVRLE